MKHLLFIISSIVLFTIVYFLVYQQVYSGGYPSDIREHITILYRYIYEQGYYIAHPLWHITSYLLSTILFISVEYGVIITSSLYVLLWYTIVYLFITQKLDDLYNTNILVFISLVVVLIGPLSIPWYYKVIFHGQGSPNIWHNVTLWSVKPFALLSIWFTVEGIDTKNRKLLLWAGIFTIISIFAKPSFIIIFLPALLIYAIAMKLYKDYYFISYFLTISSLSIAVLIYQYSHTFNQDEGKIIIDFLGVWSLSSLNIPISIFLALAFPLIFVLMRLEILNERYIMISWIMIFISIIYYTLFAQTGRFYSHANFSWSYMIAMSLLYLFSIVRFFTIYYDLSKFKRYTLLILLMVQTLIGIYYLVHMLMGQNPLYINFYWS